MPHQRPLWEWHITETGTTPWVKWSGQSATFFFSGNFAGNVITVEISPDKLEAFDPDDNQFSEKSVRTLVFGAGEWIRCNTQGGGTPDVIVKLSGETTMARG